MCFVRLYVHFFTSYRDSHYNFFFNSRFDDVLLSGREDNRFCVGLFSFPAVPFVFLPHSCICRVLFLRVHLLSRGPFYLILPLTFFCLNRLLPFVADLLETIGCEWSPMSSFCLANLFHCISMPRSGFAYAMPLIFPLKMAVLVKIYGEMSFLLDRNDRVFPRYSPGKCFFMRAGVASCNWVAGKRGKRRKQAVNTLAWRTATAGNTANTSARSRFVNSLTSHLDPP